MTKPLIPADEARRLETLQNLKLLDTPPEERFDRVTRLARRVFGVPVAILSLVDKDRQWFKSRQGLETIETPREISFCGHAITGDQVLVVTDAVHDERFNDNPLVTREPNVRFYAGCPITAPDTSKIGALGIIDREPRELSDEDLVLLRDMGRMVEEELATTNPSTNDAATGLSNRRGLSLIGQHLLTMCRRVRHPASLLVIRFANLANIDESFGYSEG
ncbi:MAG: GAF domain-containing protein, partial [Longimicrobiales bacterium]